MEKNDMKEVKLVTVRGATNFGFELANNLMQRLEKDSISPSEWPVRFPITIKQIAKIPEINNNSKVAKRVSEAARIVWKEMRAAAIEIEKDMILHPEYYDIEPRHPNHEEEFAWRHLSIAIEQVAGNVYVTEYESENAARENVYYLLSPIGLKQYMADFESDYKNFIDEVREIIRSTKQLKASIRFELICSLNEHTKTAEQITSKE